MRLKLGRPELRDYAGYFDVPSAEPGAPLTVVWAGVTTLLIEDGCGAASARLHEATCENFQRLLGRVASSADVLAELAAAPVRPFSS